MPPSTLSAPETRSQPCSKGSNWQPLLMNWAAALSRLLQWSDSTRPCSMHMEWPGFLGEVVRADTTGITATTAVEMNDAIDETPVDVQMHMIGPIFDIVDAYASAVPLVQPVVSFP